jgi:hypothetical protein
MKAQGAVEYGITTSAVGTLGAKIGSALGSGLSGAAKQVSPILQQAFPNPMLPNPVTNRQASVGGPTAVKPVAGKATKGGTSFVQIDSSPSGAAILVDNVALGRTPATLTLAKGIHDIGLIHDGYTSWQKTILLTGGEKLLLNPALKNPKTSSPMFTVQR